MIGLLRWWILGGWIWHSGWVVKIHAEIKWVPLATFDSIRFRHFLKLFQKFRLHTKILFWDDKSFYFEQQFERDDRILATGYVWATCLGSDGSSDPEKVIASIGQFVIKPLKSDTVSILQDLEGNIHEQQRNLN